MSGVDKFIILYIGVLLGVLGGAAAPQAVGEVGNFRLSVRNFHNICTKNALFYFCKNVLIIFPQHLVQ